MLNLLRTSSHEHTNDPKRPVVKTAVSEVLPSPEEERSNPVAAARPVTPSNVSVASVPVKKTRQSFLGRAVSYVGSTLGLSSHAYIQEQQTLIRRKCHHELGAEVSSRFLDTHLHSLLTFIRDERLTRLPAKGSSWDKVLLQAHQFAEQIESLHQLVEELNTSGAASQLIYGPCLLLLELGHENAGALAQVFETFHNLGLELRPLLRNANLFATSAAIQQSLSRAYVDLINIVTSIAIFFHQSAHGLHGHGAHSFAKIDLYASFGSLIEVYHSRVKRTSFDIWNHALRQAGMGHSCDVEELQRWLAPDDSVLVFLSSNNVNLAVRPEELTCTWFQSTLGSFLKSDKSTLLVEGKAGSGKTVLAHWTVDRLQRPLGRKNFSTLSFAFNQNIAAQSSALAMLKTLLYQLLELRVGNLGIYEAIVEVYREVKNVHDAETQEQKLWHALYKALQASDDDATEPIVIVIDGVDEIQGRSKVADATTKKLHELVEKFESVRFVSFCRPVDKAEHAKRIALDAERIGEDLRAVIASELRPVHHFHDRSTGEEDVIIDKLAGAAGTSFLWAHLACAYLAAQTTHKAFNDAFNALVAGPKTVTEVTTKLLEVLQLDENAKKVLSFLIAAERPLLATELQTLLQVNLERQTVDSRKVPINDILRSLRPFLVRRDGLAAVIHADLENALLMVPSSSKVSLQLTERHRDIVMRLMIYAKSCVREERDASFELIEEGVIGNLFSTHRLLEYAVRYWSLHFKRSTLYKASGKLQLPAELIAVFVGSTLFAMMEQVCWSRQYLLSEALELYTLAYRVRSEAIGIEKGSTLQSAVTCALYYHMTTRVSEAIEYFGRAAKISRTVFGAQADFTVHCCDTLLIISESLVVAKRTEIMTWREESLLILVDSYKHRHGASSQEVIEIYQRLIALYTFIKEEHKVTEYQEIIRKVTIIIGGGQEIVEGGDFDRQLNIELRKHKEAAQIELFEGSLFGEVEIIAKEELTLTLIAIIIARASKHCEKHEWAKAEELYVELWLRLTQHCHAHHEIAFHLKKIEVMLIYTRFLQERKRHTEACTIILALWREYEHHEFASAESVILLLNEVAIVMKSLSLLTYSLSVFRKCWSWFRSCHREEHEVYKRIEQNITIVSSEIVQSSKTTTTTTISESSETVIREVFESSITSTTEVTSTTIELCKSLTSIYIKQERYSEAVQSIKSILKKSWSSFFSSSIESVTMTSSFSQESIDLVLKMAHCHIMEKRLEKAEYCYVRLYRAIRASRQINDALVITYSELLLDFYRKHEYYHKAISFYQELLVAYRAFYGASHKLVIKILYELGDLCRVHNRTHGYWIEYYIEIVTVLNKGLEVCHEDAMRALIIVANYYYEDQRYSESLVYFKLVLTTFVKHGKKYKFFESIKEVQLIFEHYFRSLEESKTEISIQIAIIKEYREACLTHFGASTEISLHSTLLLAEVYSRSESYQFEAISLYEHICQHSTSTTITTKVKKSLTSLYVKKVTKETTVTKEVMERSTTIVHERYIETKKSYSCYHAETLSHFRELVMLYHKSSRREVALKEIRSLAVEWLTTITSATTFIEVAKFAAELYRHCEYVEYAHELIRELKMQIIYKWAHNEKTCGFNVTKLGQGCFAFIAAFEWHLAADHSHSLAHYISALMAEALYYERFRGALGGASTIEVIVCTARLHKVLHNTKRFSYFGEIERLAVDFFIKHERNMGKMTRSGVTAFVMVLVQHHHSTRSEAAFVAYAGHTALHEIRRLITVNKHTAALELAECTYTFLMAHEGLDDPSEISLGFQLCLLMAGRGVAASHKTQDAATAKKMLALSQKILSEVFDICERSKINLARLQLDELNELISLLGEQKDYKRLQKFLSTLWNTREGQKTWSPETRLRLGRRLVEVEFIAGDRDFAMRLCRDLWYNCRRVHGARHPSTLRFVALLRRLYTSQALAYQGANQGARARVCFQKAMALDQEMLALLAGADDGPDSDEDDDLETELGGSVAATSPDAAAADHETLLEHVRYHLHALRHAYQRHGGWHRHQGEYEALTGKVWREFGADLKLPQEKVHANKWSSSEYGNGKAESEQDVFKAPTQWAIVV